MTCHHTTQMIVAPTTMNHNVALETMPLVSAVYIKTHVTLIIAGTFITVITATPATLKLKFQQDISNKITQR